MKKLAGNEKRLRTAAIMTVMFIVLAAGGILFFVSRHGGGQTERMKKEEQAENQPSYKSLGGSDREVADIYAELYETPREEVAALYVQTKDWEKTGETLEKQFFTIPENTKYQMEQEGYSMEDMEEAEKLSAQTGIRASELMQAKGKASDGKSWEEVKKEKGIVEKQGTDAE